MANSQDTTLSNIQSKGLKLPSGNFSNTRSSGKIQELFEHGNNSDVLYSFNKSEDFFLKGPLSSRFDYRNPSQGQQNKISARSMVDASNRDYNLVKDFMSSSGGRNFLLNQFVFQGFQAFDETKVYNPMSPSIAALRGASFGFLDRPIRHIDTSNIVSGIVGAAGLGKITGAIGGFLGRGPARPSTPRSTVASEASGGIGISTLTSFVGGGDRSDKVMPKIAIDGTHGLLRGKTATDAYNGYYYSKLVNNNKGFLKNLLSSAGRFVQNNTLVGGLIPPKQPWAANYRADEKTYDLMLHSGALFDPYATTRTKGGGLLKTVVNSLIGEKRQKFSGAVEQRFFNNVSEGTQLSRKDAYINKLASFRNSVVGRKSHDKNNTNIESIVDHSLEDEVTDAKDQFGNRLDGKRLKYEDVVKIDKRQGELIEYSDQLNNFKTYIQSSGASDSKFDVIRESSHTEELMDMLTKTLTNIAGRYDNKYYLNDSRKYNSPLQFSTFKTNAIGRNYIDAVNDNNKNQPENNFTQNGRTIESDANGNFPSLYKRLQRPTNDVDYVNSLSVLSDDFKSKYLDRNNGYGADIISFYFYDVVNEKYIPFNATVTNITDTNNAEWETVEYAGRADKLYHYKGFTRSVTFQFKCVGGSIKELLPMWRRINYFVGLTKPANYTDDHKGYIVPPLVQLTLGDFYKNHNVVLTNITVNIPEDASWETVPEHLAKDWSWGPNDSFIWRNSVGKFAQFPIEAEISVNMNIMEKSLPKVGRTMWGNYEFKRVQYKNQNGELIDTEHASEENGVDSFSKELINGTVSSG